MGTILLILKILASLFLVALFVAGVFKANPRSHDPEYPPLAEYGAGFISCALACVGLYYLWT
ncbi:hypothetical protein ACXYTJ_06130 [Gilvimarinus sp. F26214L]|uniref:hypothetical protein n=1 Tax=Gilvimarinus sp. DZF01 TaxID=3461371 RepID=UPI0040467873